MYLSGEQAAGDSRQRGKLGTTRAVCEAYAGPGRSAGPSEQGRLLYHFDSKEQLIADVIARILKYFERDWEGA